MPARKFRTEGPVLYGRYQSGHGEWLELEEKDDVAVAYPGGYLPYSGDPSDPRHLFYMARSLRVALDRLAMDKKRRYDHRQWETHGLEREVLAKEEFRQRYGRESEELAMGWMEARFGKPYLGRERFRYVLEKPFLETVATWRKGSALEAFAFIVTGPWGAHYWFAFYRHSREGTWPPGHGYMLDFLLWARGQDLPHAYLGTAYGMNSRYKTRGLEGIEFWDGSCWCPDRKELAARREDDEKRFPAAAGER